MTATFDQSLAPSGESQEQKKSMLDTIQKTLDTAVEDDPPSGVYRVSRDIFTDPQMFELEMKHIFEGNWIYLAHGSQIPNKNDYFTTYMGRQPIFIARNRDGELNAFINACSHRGAMLCRFKRGNKATYTCPFHGWTFNNSGKLLKVKDPEGAGYPDGFNKPGSHDLTRVARFESYRGFLFGSLNPDVPPLAAHLGEAAKIIDLMVDQSPEGLEVLRGASTYVYDGNWKLQTENGADGYHVSTVHWNYVATTQRRVQADQPDNVRAMNLSSIGEQGGGFYSFANGHLLLWGNSANPEDRPIWERSRKWAAQFGQARADWMVRRFRNLCLYPNVCLMDQMSSQIRQYRPIAVDKTEVTIYCIAPKGESAEARARRIRQYEDFFNASGMATPDDLEEFRGCQMSYRGRAARWNDLSRGAQHWIQGPDAVAGVFRIRTERSSATSMPQPRTSHNISNVEILTQGGGVCELRCNWVTFSYRYKMVDTYFGTSFYTLDTTAAQPLIKRKKVILKNDYIHQVVDIYHL